MAKRRFRAQQTLPSGKVVWLCLRCRRTLLALQYPSACVCDNRDPVTKGVAK